MGIFSEVDSGTKAFHSRYTKSISNTMRYDCRFHDLIPVLKRFVLPGDVWRCGGDALVRFQPMLSPSMTPYNFRVRYFFVPLRLVEEDTELVITGSKDGHLYTSELPKFSNFIAHADKNTDSDAFKVLKYSFWDYMNVQIGDYEDLDGAKFLPAEYWAKAYSRIWYDYYRDENYFNRDLDTFMEGMVKHGANYGLHTSRIAKDYFSSALPWQLKAISAPRLNVTGSAQWSNFPTWQDVVTYPNAGTMNLTANTANVDATDKKKPFGLSDEGTIIEQDYKNFADRFLNLFDKDSINITGLGFNADEFRTMMQQTRIFERLARCGSRYTEYLRSNFGTAPADDTLQRAQYLGGWKIPVITSEVLQTAADGTTPVGTMRGHGITRGGNTIPTFYAKEFGMIFGIAEIRPQIEYTTGIPRQLTYKERFEFFNPSLQHLSEQEVRNGELFVNFTPDSDGNYDNDETLGFQAYGNELRSSQDEVVGDMRDSLSFWGSSLHFTSRPNVSGLLNAANHRGSFNAPFAVSNVNARPVIVTFRNNLDVYRPMVRFSTPGLVDHL